MGVTTWDERAETIAKDLWATNSATQISEKLVAEGYGFSRQAVIGKLHRLGFNAKRKSKVHPQTRNDLAKPISVVRPGQFVCNSIVDVEPFSITLLQLERHHCRWPRGEGVETVFCGKPKFGSSSYCESHFHISVGRGTPSERSAHCIGNAA